MWLKYNSMTEHLYKLHTNAKLAHTSTSKHSSITLENVLPSQAVIITGTWHCTYVSRYVIEPYHKYPSLLDVLFNFLKTEQTSGVRREVIRVLGLLGALDPYKHTQHQRNEKRSKMGTPTSKPMDKKSQGTGQC